MQADGVQAGRVIQYEGAFKKKLNDAISSGCARQPEEMASLVAFVAGDWASYMAATTVFADAGLMHSSLGLSRGRRRLDRDSR